jgi:hypothetical protein
MRRFETSSPPSSHAQCRREGDARSATLHRCRREEGDARTRGCNLIIAHVALRGTCDTLRGREGRIFVVYGRRAWRWSGTRWRMGRSVGRGEERVYIIVLLCGISNIAPCLSIVVPFVFFIIPRTNANVWLPCRRRARARAYLPPGLDHLVARAPSLVAPSKEATFLFQFLFLKKESVPSSPKQKKSLRPLRSVPRQG